MEDATNKKQMKQANSEQKTVPDIPESELKMPTEHVPRNQQGSGGSAGIFIAVLVGFFVAVAAGVGAYFFFGDRIMEFIDNPTAILNRETNQEVADPNATSTEVEETATSSETENTEATISDSLDDIERDLENVNLSGFDEELGAVESEIEGGASASSETSNTNSNTEENNSTSTES